VEAAEAEAAELVQQVALVVVLVTSPAELLQQRPPIRAVVVAPAQCQQLPLTESEVQVAQAL
jgi:hypothetical protein